MFGKRLICIGIVLLFSVGSMPIKANMSSVPGSLFPEFPFKNKIPEVLAWAALDNKLTIRKLMKGGPLMIPDYFKLLNFETNTPPEFPLNANMHSNIGISPQIMDDECQISPKVLIDKIVNGHLDLPMVFKPVFSALGEGIVILRRENDQNYFTMINDPLSKLQKEFLEKYPMTMSDNSNVVNFQLSNLEDSLHRLLELQYSPTENDYGLNHGMVESYIDSIKPNDQAFETRHRVVGNLASLEVFEIEDGIARVGESPWFSNLTTVQNKSAYKRLTENKMGPLIESNFLEESREDEFREFIHGKLVETFKYFGARLTENGFSFGRAPTELQIDLVYLPPEKEGDFPIPTIMEVDWRYKIKSLDNLLEAYLPFVTAR